MIETNYLIKTPILLQSYDFHAKKTSNCFSTKYVKIFFEKLLHLFFSFFSLKDKSCSSSSSGCKKKYIDRKIQNKNLAPSWEQIIPEKRGATGEGHLSHLREVYLSHEQNCVVKISSSVDRKRKGSNNDWPHAEEIAYKINKLFSWNVIPKTKLMHGSELTNNLESKYEKYVDIQKSMVHREISKIAHFTFTFQTLVKGKTFPHHGRKDQKIDSKSYQQAYLLGIILGKKDARADNTMYDSESRQIFEIDNESLGCKNYSNKGILRKFESLQEETIHEQILDIILNVALEDIKKIEEKYQPRDAFLLKQWILENPKSTKTSNETLKKHWKTIQTNLTTLQKAARKLKDKHKNITIKKLEKKYVKYR